MVTVISAAQALLPFYFTATYNFYLEVDHAPSSV